MTKHIRLAAGLVSLLAGLVVNAQPAINDRTIPHPLPSHPGNIFLTSESISVPLPPGNSEAWRVIDYEGKSVAGVQVASGQAKLKPLPVGYYELVPASDNGSNRISIGVVEALHAPTPMSSPIGIDVALAWCFPKEKWDAAISLTQLAGMNRVRDRMLWEEIEPQRGKIIADTKYDASLKLQNAAGLQMLQVNHVSPSWANTNVKHFPLDLRDVYNSYREFAHRWKGQMVAFEPWNEADIVDFGGHTGSEMATLQKAAYLGLKAGNPDLTVCMNVFAIHRLTTLRNFGENKAWPYFETFNVHHYEPLAAYPKVYTDFREVSAGKPIWTTECNVTVQWTGDEQRKEPDAENLRIQSERVAKIYVEAMHEGSKSVFYFMLPYYTERKLQYGLLHPDLTPRPAYLAAAAAGRLLADAKPLGQVESKDEAVHGFVFNAKPDGKEADVLVIWSDEPKDFELAESPAACFDHLGRAKAEVAKILKLTTAPLFVMLAKNVLPKLVAPPKQPPLLTGKAGSVVIQALPPEKEIVVNKSAYKMDADQTNEVPIYIYNFGTNAVHGHLDVSVPQQWKADFSKEADIAPGERKELTLKLSTDKKWMQAARVRINGDFGEGSQAVLALRFVSSEE